MDKVMVLGSPQYFAPYYRFGEITTNIEEIDQVSLVAFCGGADVNPRLYNERAHPYTSYDAVHDSTDIIAFTKARQLNLPMVGICRGSQFLCVMAGGKTVQHTNNHGISGTHKAIIDTGEEIDVTSTHHQMAWPWHIDHKILAYAEGLSTIYEAEDVGMERHFPPRAMLDNGLVMEPEAVYYPTINALGVQWHPEYMDENSRGFIVFQDYVEDLMRGVL